MKNSQHILIYHYYGSSIGMVWYGCMAACVYTLVCMYACVCACSCDCVASKRIHFNVNLDKRLPRRVKTRRRIIRQLGAKQKKRKQNFCTITKCCNDLNIAFAHIHTTLHMKIYTHTYTHIYTHWHAHTHTWICTCSGNIRAIKTSHLKCFLLKGNEAIDHPPTYPTIETTLLLVLHLIASHLL